MTDLRRVVARSVRVRTIACCAALALAACGRTPNRLAEGNGTSETAKRVRLAECGPDLETCLIVDGASSVSSRATLGGGSTFGPSPLTWMLIAHTQAARSRILVLFDVSGSMKGEGMANGRAAVASFLAKLPEDRTIVGVAPFESHSVVKRIRSARLGTPTEAVRSLDSLPQPGGNTGLYSAIREGAQLLANRSTEGEAHLIVVTDGMNDVRAGDDQGLLDGPAGLEAAVEAAAQSSVQVWTVGVGTSPDRRELAALAGRDDRTQIIVADPVELSRALQRIAERIVGNNRLVIGAAGAPAMALGAGPRTIRALIHDEAGSRIVGGTWMPPLLAAPTPIRRFPEHGSTTALDEASIGISWWRWALLFMPLAVVLLCAVPATLAMDAAPLRARETAAPVRDPGTLRTAVRERPRSPEELTPTHQFAARRPDITPVGPPA